MVAIFYSCGVRWTYERMYVRRYGYDVGLPDREFRRIIFRSGDFAVESQDVVVPEATTIEFERNYGAIGRETCTLYTMA